MGAHAKLELFDLSLCRIAKICYGTHLQYVHNGYWATIFNNIKFIKKWGLYKQPRFVHRNAFSEIQENSALIYLVCSENLSNISMAWLQANSERHWRSSRQTIIFFEINRFSRNLIHVKRPEHSGDSQPDLTFSHNHPWTNATPNREGTYNVSKIRECEVCYVKFSYPAPNIQWSLSYGLARFADSVLFVLSLIYLSG